MSDNFKPNFKTPDADLCKEELNKISSNQITGNLYEDVRDNLRDDLPWESEQLAKSYGVYLEFDRAKTGSQKDWSYMVRITIPGGGPLNRQQWQVLDRIARRYTASDRSAASLRLTTRQNIQLHWVKKSDLQKVIAEIAESGFSTLNGCGDNVRNIMACPLSRYSPVFNGNRWAVKAANYFQLPLEPFIKIFEVDTSLFRTEEESGAKFNYGEKLLNRKFKMAFSAVTRNPATGLLEADNCVELRTNDLGIAPILKGEVVQGFQIFIGGGQGEKWGKPTMATLAQPLCSTGESSLLAILDAIVNVHKEWGDRQNRHWARLKYLVKAKGISWYREQVSERLGFQLEEPLPDFNEGPRQLHHGWFPLEDGSSWAFGAFIENGRLTDSSENGRLLSMVTAVFDSLPHLSVLITANQDLLFTGIADQERDKFYEVLLAHGYGFRNGKPYSKLRLASGACVGRDTCRLTYTDSEKFEPYLIDQLEQMGWGDLAESIGITGCERQCFRPSTKTIGLVGSGLDRYQLRLMGTEDARSQGGPLISEDGEQIYLRSIPRDEVAKVIDSLFRFYSENSTEQESLGHFHQRLGCAAIIDHLKSQGEIAHLMEKTTPFKGLT